MNGESILKWLRSVEDERNMLETVIRFDRTFPGAGHITSTRTYTLFSYLVDDDLLKLSSISKRRAALAGTDEFTAAAIRTLDQLHRDFLCDAASAVWEGRSVSELLDRHNEGVEVVKQCLERHFPLLKLDGKKRRQFDLRKFLAASHQAKLLIIYPSGWTSRRNCRLSSDEIHEWFNSLTDASDMITQAEGRSSEVASYILPDGWGSTFTCVKQTAHDVLWELVVYLSVLWRSKELSPGDNPIGWFDTDESTAVKDHLVARVDRELALLTEFVFEKDAAERASVTVAEVKVQNPNPVKRVTIEQIAAAVFLERRSMSRYSKEWPKPAIEQSGRRAAEYDLDSILPILIRQFPRCESSLRKLG